MGTSTLENRVKDRVYITWDSMCFKVIQPERFSKLIQPNVSCPISTESWKLSDLVKFCKYAKRGASEVKKLSFSTVYFEIF